MFSLLLTSRTVRALGRIACAFSLLAAVASTAPAQIPGKVRPDVLLVVAADYATGQWAVSAVYPKVVPKARMQAHAKRLLSLSGWQGTGFTYETRGLPKRNAPPDPPMSSVTFRSRSNIVDWRDATLPVEPFARAYRDLDRVYVTFFVPGRFPFRGLRQHSDANLDVNLTASGSAYTYVMNIKNHRLESLNLPRYQTPPQPVARVRVAETQKAGPVQAVGTGLVVLAAALAGVVMYVWVHRWSAR